MLMPAARRSERVGQVLADCADGFARVGARLLDTPRAADRAMRRLPARSPVQARASRIASTGPELAVRPAHAAKATCARARRRSLHGIVAQDTQRTNRAAQSASPSTEITIDGFDPGANLGSRREIHRRAHRPLCQRPDSCNCCSGASASRSRPISTWPSDLAAQQAAQRAHGHGHGADPLPHASRRIASVSASPAGRLAEQRRAQRSWQPCSSTHRQASRLPLSTVET